VSTKPAAAQVYVACLAAYNNGCLHGAWMDAAREPWALYDDVKAMLAASPITGAEEWAVHDYEGFGGIRIEESTGLDAVAELACFIAEKGEVGAALLDHFGGELIEARAVIADSYLGAHASLADYVQDATEETTSIPESLRSYIDWRAMARDAELSGDLFTVTTAWDVVHVFAGS
jgi:antirestriction protein